MLTRWGTTRHCVALAKRTVRKAEDQPRAIAQLFQAEKAISGLRGVIPRSADCLSCGMFLGNASWFKCDSL
jgi:hypothetical protein